MLYEFSYKCGSAMKIYLLNGCVRLNRGVAQLVSDRNYLLNTWEYSVLRDDVFSMVVMTNRLINRYSKFFLLLIVILRYELCILFKHATTNNVQYGSDGKPFILRGLVS